MSAGYLQANNRVAQNRPHCYGDGVCVLVSVAKGGSGGGGGGGGVIGSLGMSHCGGDYCVSCQRRRMSSHWPQTLS